MDSSAAPGPSCKFLVFLRSILDDRTRNQEDRTLALPQTFETYSIKASYASEPAGLADRGRIFLRTGRRATCLRARRRTAFYFRHRAFPGSQLRPCGLESGLRWDHFDGEAAAISNRIRLQVS